MGRLCCGLRCRQCQEGESWGEGRRAAALPTHLSSLRAAVVGNENGSSLQPTHHLQQTVPLPDRILIPPAAIPGWWEMRASCSFHGHPWDRL